jgi:hypothetical protein
MPRDLKRQLEMYPRPLGDGPETVLEIGGPLRKLPIGDIRENALDPRSHLEVRNLLNYPLQNRILTLALEAFKRFDEHQSACRTISSEVWF